MFGNLFSSAPKLSPVGQFCYDLISRNRFEASGGRKDLPKYLPVVYATHPEFIGSVLALIDFGKQIIKDPVPQKETTRKLMDALFGDSANTAMVTVINGVDNDPLMTAFEQVSAHLERAATLPRDQTEKQLLFLAKYF